MQKWCFIYPLALLAKAFFYARARSLLVSHWIISLEATVKLIIRMFENVANHNSIGKRKILRKFEKIIPRKQNCFLRHLDVLGIYGNVWRRNERPLSLFFNYLLIMHENKFFYINTPSSIPTSH